MNLITIPKDDFLRLLAIANHHARVTATSVEMAQRQEAEINQTLERVIETHDLSTVPSSTPVCFHTTMTIRHQPYKALHLDGGRWQWFDPRGQWVKLDYHPVGTWSPLV